MSAKLGSITAESLSGIQRIRRQRNGQNRQAVETPAGRRTEAGAQAGRRPVEGIASPLANSIPFGGDSLVGPRPPPIGFRLPDQSTPLKRPADQPSHQQQQQQPQQQLAASNESLYQGDAWTRLWFQRFMILSLIRLVLFVRKVYEDYQATKRYNSAGQTGYFLISAATLFLPTLVFATYRVTRYLQLALPSLRILKEAQRSYPATTRPSDEEDLQSRRALMSSPEGATSQQQQQVAAEEDGLVTARQTPSQLEEFHDSKESAIELDQSSASQAKLEGSNTADDGDGGKPKAVESKLETVDIDKLGDLPDKETVRVAICVGEQLLHGALFVFWQLKRQVDVLGYLVERACLWRKPNESEKAELGRLQTGSDGLEWFQDFYAAFLAILSQVYALGLHWSATSGGLDSNDGKRIRANIQNAAANSLAGSDLAEGPQVSKAAQSIGNLLSSESLRGEDVLIMSELIVSSAVVFSLLVAVRRRDDGLLTTGLSMLGWGSIFAARIIVIALAFVHLGWRPMLSLVGLHLLGITCWIYKIAIDSHNDRPSERQHEAIWDQADGVPEVGRPAEGIELDEASASAGGRPNEKVAEGPSGEAGQLKAEVAATSRWSLLEHLTLLAQIFTLFAMPSLFYWPVMFNLKLHLRPFKYLVLILTQNFLLIAAIWFTVSQSATVGQLYLLGAVGALSIGGFVFIALYISCKPTLTEYFAQADVQYNNAETCGIYFEFCSRVFKMPDLSKRSFQRLLNQSDELIEEQWVEVER